METITNCNQCPNQCSLSHLKCGRGRHYLNSLQMEGKATDIIMKDDVFKQGSEKHSGNHEHKKFHNHHKEFHNHHKEFHNMDDLSCMMRACGHVLYHQAGKKNGQGRIMHILSNCESMTQKDLQEMLQIQPGSLSEILSKMENSGLIDRIKDEEDKRKTIIKMTDAGKLHVEEFRKSHKKRDMFQALDTAQQDELKKLLKILLDDWKKENEE